MQCKKVSWSREQLLDPGAKEWGSIPGEALKMDATPLANQPSEYIKASRDAKNIGKVKNLLVQTVHNGSDVFMRLSWEDAVGVPIRLNHERRHGRACPRHPRLPC